MLREHCLYTDAQLKRMGFNPDNFNHPVCLPDSNKEDVLSFVKGKFANVIDAIFTSTDGSLDNVLAMSVSEHAPQSVQTFIRNVLMCDVQAVQAAPDDETAFDTLIPRSAQSSAEIAPYLDSLRQIVSDARERAMSSIQTE